MQVFTKDLILGNTYYLNYRNKSSGLYTHIGRFKVISISSLTPHITIIWSSSTELVVRSRGDMGLEDYNKYGGNPHYKVTTDSSNGLKIDWIKNEICL